MLSDGHVTEQDFKECALSACAIVSREVSFIPPGRLACDWHRRVYCLRSMNLYPPSLEHELGRGSTYPRPLGGFTRLIPVGGWRPCSGLWVG